MKRVGLVMIFVTVAAVLVWLFVVRPWRVREAQRATAELFVRRTINEPLRAFRVHVGRYPTTEEGLGALLVAPRAVEHHWRGPYVDPAIPLDPWGREYQYRAPGRKNTSGYDVWSLGPDPSRNADDIGNWEP